MTRCGPSEVYAVLRDLADEGAPADAKLLGGMGAVALPALKGADDGALLDVLERDCILVVGMVGRLLRLRTGDGTPQVEVLHLDYVPFREDHRTLEDVLKLPDIAVEVMPAQQVQGLGSEACDPGAHAPVVLAYDGCGQKRDVLAALPQWRNLDPHDVEAVEEVLAEGAFLDHGLEVLVRRGNDARVDRHGSRPAQPCDLPLLEHTQYLDLKGEWHVADLVQEECASACQLEHAVLAAGSSGECALLIAEELALKEVLRHTSDVDRHEGATAHRRAVVDLAGDDLLACTALACDQDGGVGGCDLPDDLLDVGHLGALADEGALVLLARLGVLDDVAEVRGLDQALDLDAQLLRVEGLDDVVLGPFLECRHCVADVPMGTDHDHRHAEALAAYPANQVQAIHARHLQIDKDGVIGLVTQHALGRQPVLSAIRVYALDGEELAHRRPYVHFVVDYQNNHLPLLARFVALVVETTSSCM